MEGNTREKVGAAQGKEPFFMAPPKTTSRASSSCPQFASASSYPAQAAKENNKRVENPTADNPSKKNPITTRGNMAPNFSSEDFFLQRQLKQNKKRASASVPDPIQSSEETNSVPLQQKRRRVDENPSSSSGECIDMSTTTDDINQIAGDQVEVGNAVAASVGVVARTQEKGRGKNIAFCNVDTQLKLDVLKDFNTDSEDWEICSLWDKPYPVGNFIDKYLSAPIDLDKYKRVGGQGLSFWVEANALRVASIARANQKEFHAMKRYIALLEEKVRSTASIHAIEKETLKKQIAMLEGLIGLVKALGENLAKDQKHVYSLEAYASKLLEAEKRAEIAEKEVERVSKFNEELIRKVTDLEKQVKEDAETIREQSWHEMKDGHGSQFFYDFKKGIVLNGVKISKTQVDVAQQPQNQSQMSIAKWDNRPRSIPNFKLVKSEPES